MKKSPLFITTLLITVGWTTQIQAQPGLKSLSDWFSEKANKVLPFTPNKALPIATIGGAVRGSGCELDRESAESVFISLEPETQQASLDLDGKPIITAYAKGLKGKTVDISIIGENSSSNSKKVISEDGIILIPAPTTNGNIDNYDWTLRVICDTEASVNDPVVSGSFTLVPDNYDLETSIEKQSWYSALDEAVKTEDRQLINYLVQSINPNKLGDGRVTLLD